MMAAGLQVCSLPRGAPRERPATSCTSFEILATSSGKPTVTFRTLPGAMKLPGGSHAANVTVVTGGVQDLAQGQDLGQEHVTHRDPTAVGIGLLKGDVY